jgi:hypothetical protein
MNVVIEPIDELKEVIISITDAMQNDFATQYAKLYANLEDLRQYKRLLYSKLKGSSVIDIKTAYSDYVKSGNPFCPTFQNLLTFVIKSEKERKKPIPVVVPVIEKIKPARVWSTKIDEDGYTAEELDVRHQENIILHKAKLMADSHLIRHVYADHTHLCNFDGCSKAGSICSGTYGDGDYYCMAHYRIKN